MTLLTFAGVAALLTLVPGPDSLLVLRTAIAQGRRAALVAALGIQVGCLWWGAAAGLGLTAVLAASHTLYTVLRWVGAAYLLYLGAGLLLRRGRAGEAAGASGRNRFLTGLLTNALNPKVGVFYLSLLPQFVPAGAPVLPWSLLLTGVHVTEGVLWCALLVALADRLGRVLRPPRVGRVLDRVAGTAFLGFALRLALRP
ncbi:LysE family translocator [Actinoallomurus soli]|uniref:LysE family translocator n=1 Tax=Actinoallomurus soli TaxID=2952535 RepID=UPI00209292E4|nr:LysE family translocator [Actinoallomurus soli]MCO5971216.1 LysE family translocator [Actinoallomurus soli]